MYKNNIGTLKFVKKNKRVSLFKNTIPTSLPDPVNLQQFQKRKKLKLSRYMKIKSLLTIEVVCQTMYYNNECKSNNMTKNDINIFIRFKDVLYKFHP